jgi:hypothetical protein
MNLIEDAVGLMDLDFGLCLNPCTPFHFQNDWHAAPLSAIRTGSYDGTVA